MDVIGDAQENNVENVHDETLLIDWSDFKHDILLPRETWRELICVDFLDSTSFEIVSDELLSLSDKNVDLVDCFTNPDTLSSSIESVMLLGSDVSEHLA